MELGKSATLQNRLPFHIHITVKTTNFLVQKEDVCWELSLVITLIRAKIKNF